MAAPCADPRRGRADQLPRSDYEGACDNEHDAGASPERSAGEASCGNGGGRPLAQSASHLSEAVVRSITIQRTTSEVRAARLASCHMQHLEPCLCCMRESGGVWQLGHSSGVHALELKLRFAMVVPPCDDGRWGG